MRPILLLMMMVMLCLLYVVLARWRQGWRAVGRLVEGIRFHWRHGCCWCCLSFHCLWICLRAFWYNTIGRITGVRRSYRRNSHALFYYGGVFMSQISWGYWFFYRIEVCVQRLWLVTPILYVLGFIVRETVLLEYQIIWSISVQSCFSGVNGVNTQARFQWNVIVFCA